jgi:hypothetical protein
LSLYDSKHQVCQDDTDKACCNEERACGVDCVRMWRCLASCDAADRTDASDAQATSACHEGCTGPGSAEFFALSDCLKNQSSPDHGMKCDPIGP